MRCNMNKKFSFLCGLLGLAGAASAATAVVWSDEEGAKVTKEPAYFYTFAYPEGGSASIDTTNVNGAKVLDLVAPMGSASEGAGYGFAWQQNTTTYKDVAVSLATYKGACLTYEASAPFRVDFKQSTITDDNFYGYELVAAATPKKQFIAFADLTQGWKSTTAKAWSVTSQTGVQFSFKNTHANKAKVEENEVILHSFILADECVTNAPNVKDSFTGNGATIDLEEGGVYEVALADVFEDADGDDLSITVSITSENKSVVLQNAGTSFSLNDVLQFTTAPNPDGPADVVITATDPTKKTAKISFTINTSDTENLPVAKSSFFEVKEDSVLKVGLGNQLVKNYGFDADGDEIKMILVSEPKHGVLSDINLDYGTFTYTPDQDFYGEDSFSYKFVEVDDETRKSENVGVCTITVINVNDEPAVEVVAETFMLGEEEMTFGDTVVVDEDFEPFVIAVPKANLVITDADGEEDYKVIAKNSSVYTSELIVDNTDYLIEITAKKDSNGISRLNLVVEDPKVSIPTPIAIIKVNPVADPITPVADTYKVYQDSLNKIDAKKGVLANDLNPDKDTTASVVVDFEPEHGKLVLAADGSFTYDADADFEGEDYFTYKIKNADGTTSKSVMVTLEVLYKNKAPKIVEGVMDTVNVRLDTLREDFNIVTYKKAELQTWFKDDSTIPSKLKFTAKSADSTVAVSFSSVGALQVKSVKNVCGDVSLTLTATDEGGASTDLVIEANLECVNDKPVLTPDTAYIAGEGASIEYDLNGLATDVDGDTLIFKVAASASVTAYFDVVQEDNKLTLTAKEGTGLLEGMAFPITVKIADPTMANAETPTTLTGKLTVIVGEEPDAIKPTIAVAKMNWQGAIQANRGMAAIFDMQGRVMWKSALPVSEAEVRAAAASVQGRKVLRVNQQTFTIK